LLVDQLLDKTWNFKQSYHSAARNLTHYQSVNQSET